MKTWEIYKIALENPNAKFRLLSDCLDQGKIFTLHKGDIFVGDTRKGCCLLVPRIDGEWELVREQVSWQEAIQAWVKGKKVYFIFNDIKTYLNNSFYLRTDFVGREVISKHEIEHGKWYIED